MNAVKERMLREAREQGIEQGIEQGMSQGRAEVLRGVISHMGEIGNIPLPEIARLIGLPLEEVEALAAPDGAPTPTV